MHDVATFPTQTHNGWSNHETWAVNLWLTNEQAYDDVLMYIIETYEADERAYELEAWVQEEFDRLSLGASLWSDLLTTSLARVNWSEIIDSNLE